MAPGGQCSPSIILGLSSGAVYTGIAQDLVRRQSSRPSPEPGIPSLSCGAGKLYFSTSHHAPGREDRSKVM